jgi:hypothetical protein
MSMLRSNRWVARAAAFVCASMPVLVHACPLCFAAKNDANRVAFLGTTLLLTGLPIAMIGGFIFWIVRRLEALDSEEQRAPSVAEQPVVVTRREGLARH